MMPTVARYISSPSGHSQSRNGLFVKSLTISLFRSPPRPGFAVANDGQEQFFERGGRVVHRIQLALMPLDHGADLFLRRLGEPGRPDLRDIADSQQAVDPAEFLQFS